MRLGQIAERLASQQLQILGGFYPVTGDGAPEGVETLLMIGPDEPGFWPYFQASEEYEDGAENAMDRWSARVIGTVAQEVGARALFPFGGPPWHPFIGWALKTGHIWKSPVELLVHDTAGLFVSFRGALGLAERIDLPPPPARPCDSCAGQPCRTACPVGALTPLQYDVPGCQDFLSVGGECLNQGCAVRRACPVGQNRRLADQSAFHMKAFAR